MIITSNKEHKKPFNEEILKKEFTGIKSPAKVTSIPSPYAQMHLFNMAFFAANAFIQKNAADTDEVRKIYEGNIEGEHPGLYDRLISHCLDIHELLFYWDKLNLGQRGFSIKTFALPEVSTLTAKTKGKEKDKHFNFRTTLDLYIDRYATKLGVSGDTIDCGYYICYNDEIIAVTAPLTGFYISSSVDFGIAGIRGLWQDDDSIVYLSNDEDTYRPLGSRDEKFRIFLHKIIENYCPKGYTYFKEYVKEYAKKMELVTKYNSDTTIDLNKYGFGKKDQIDLLKGAVIIPDKKEGKEKKNEENIIAIPDRYNKIYFRSLLEVKKYDGELVKFQKTAEDYKEPLDARKLLGKPVKWLSVNDFFQKNIIELDDAINTDRFYCCRVIDENGKESDVKVLLPLKERFFEFFNFDKGEKAENQLVERLEVKKVSNEKYVAVLKVPTQSGEVLLSKEYLEPEKDEYGKITAYRDANIIKLIKNESLYMGIYPFVKDTQNKENNGFFRIFTYHSDKLSSDLKFFKDTANGLSAIENKDKERHIAKKIFKQDFDKFPVSTFYALESRYFNKDEGYKLSNDKNVDFEIIKIGLKKDSIAYEAFLIPQFIKKNCTNNSGMLSVDFGTSNTNISLGIDGSSKKIDDYDSFIADEKSNKISLMVMLHKPKDGKFDFEATSYGAPNQNHLLSEFMPAVISKDSEYRFAIPSILNLHSDKVDAKSVSLVDANIPVAYYSKGLRKLGETHIDRPRSDFKWTGNDTQKQLYVSLFIDQLLLMARSFFIANAQNLKDVKVIYTTPLSMKDNGFYAHLWKALYQKYFVKDETTNLLNISESRAPYFASGEEFGADSAVLLDVGGGSTDILFYNDKGVKATTSYAYAANALFAGNRNENIFMKQMPPKPSEDKEQGMSELEESVTIPVCDVFNYRFAKKKPLVEEQFRKNPEWQYLLALHSSAILYHAIQNNKALFKENNLPKKILLSGNGAKLFELLDTNDLSNAKLIKLAKKITQFIYEPKETKAKTEPEEPALSIGFVDSKWVGGVEISTKVGMKAATSVGSLCWKMEGVKTDGGVTEEPKIIPLGDDKTVLKNADLEIDDSRSQYNAADKNKQEEIIKAVTENFNHFLKGFFGDENTNSLFGYSLKQFCSKPLDKEIVERIIKENDLIRTSIKDYHIDHPTPEHSIFFVPLQRLIIELSKYFASKS